MSNYFDDIKFSTLIELLRYRAQSQSDKLAFTFLLNGETEKASFTYQGLDQKARAIAAELQSIKATNERVLLLYPPSEEFIAAFFGCLYAGAVAVPAYPPRPNKSLSRLQAIVADAQATVALTTTTVLSNIEGQLTQLSDLQALQWIATDNIKSENAWGWQQPKVNSETLAFLQYTSGSTGTPKGVMVNHGNLLHNEQMIQKAFGHTPNSSVVGWLPLYHDMGLIGNVLQPLYLGIPCILMSPVDFIKKPFRWLQAISRYRATTSGGPNFAYDLCVSKVTPEQRENLDLSSWEVAFNGAEPIRADTLEQFSTTFSSCGFRREAFYPCYGMAETTLLVSGGLKIEPPVITSVDGDALSGNQVIGASKSNDNTSTLVSCGQNVVKEQQIVIAHPETSRRCSSNEVGEIWVSGPSVASGYWRRDEETQATFGAYLADTREGPFLRTGDLGFLKDGELFVTGRLKDLIIIRGRNYYPQDIELILEKSHPALRTGASAAFTVDLDGEERLVVACEVERTYLRKLDGDAIVKNISGAVAEQQELEVYTIVLLKTNTIPKTSSGKIQRRACRAGFMAGSLNVVWDWSKNPESKVKFRHLLAQVESDEQQIKPNQKQKINDYSYVGKQKSNQDNHFAKPEVLQEWLVSKVSKQLKVNPQDVNIWEPFARYGLDSMAAISIIGELEQRLGRELSPTLVYDYPNISVLVEHLTSESNLSRATLKNDANPTTEKESIAIIGLGCRFPGANNPETFWQLLTQGVDAITEVPTSRWNIDSFYNKKPATPGKMSTRWGGFLEQVDQFDPQFFGISPREAQGIDPQQRLLLEVAWEAIENAGIAPPKLTGSHTGVFIGISSNDYFLLQHETSSDIDAYRGTGNASSIAANRLSYWLDLHGPSLAVDTACSSSLVATHMACQSLHNRECNLAIVGGVNLILSPDLTIAFSQAQMMATDGRCKTFDKDADGYVRSEGCGVVILKRLSDAIADQDNILAVIKGSAVNQDGRSNGLTAPNGPSQQQVIRQALENAGVAPEEISYVETHGTGTVLGDPIEVESLKAVLSSGRKQDQPCVLGSVKANIGHLEAAAGIASLIKAVLCLQNQEIPPQLHLKQLNPHISLEETSFFIPSERVPWSTNNSKNSFVGVSSFGFGGTNAHLILSKAPEESQKTKDKSQNQEVTERQLHLLTLSAKSENALRNLAQRYQKFLDTNSQVQLADICFTANTGREHFAHRLAVVAESSVQLREQLNAFASAKHKKGIVNGFVQGKNRPKMAFLFTGQGSQYPDMGLKLYQTQPTFRQALQQCDELLHPYLKQSLLKILYGTPEETRVLNETAYTQPVLFSLEYALSQLWRSWGIVPDVVMGHSLGEYVAACVAGVFSLEEGLKLVVERSQLMQSLPDNGEMAVVFTDEAQVANIISKYDSQIAIAVINGKDNIVISGIKQAVESAISEFSNQGITVQRLNVSHAFHSPLMEPILDEFERKSCQINYQPLSIPLVSNRTGEILKSGEILDGRYWCHHLGNSVQFAQGMNALAEYGCKIFVEVGPNTTLVAMGKRCLAKYSCVWLPSLKKGQDDWRVLLNTLSVLETQGIDIDWDGFDSSDRRHRVCLPTYPFERKRYWIDSNQNTDVKLSASKPTIEKTPVSKTMDSIRLQLRNIVARLLHTDLESVDIYAPFLEMGADSLVLVEAIQAIESRFGIKVAIRQLFEELSTIDALANFIGQNISPELAFSFVENKSELSEDTQIHQAVEATDTTPLMQEFSEETIAPQTSLERIMNKQLQVMSEQIDLLRGKHLSSEGKSKQEKANPQSAHPKTNGTIKSSRRIRQEETTQIKYNGALFEQNPQQKPTQTFSPIHPQTSIVGLNEQQQQHLQALIARYNQRTQKSKQVAQTYRPILADSRASAGFRPSIKEMLYPIIGKKAQGSRFWDLDGNEYVDITMGFGVLLCGHAPPFVTQALESQIKEGIQIGPQSNLAGVVASLICQLTGGERVTFCNSGTEAIMTALRLARTSTGRTKIALFTNSYHGHFDGVLARAANGSYDATPISPGISEYSVQDVLVLDYGDFKSIDILQAHAHELAAVLVEPVQSRRLDLQPKEFLKKLRQLTLTEGIALIFDEIITGFRIHPGGAQAWFEIDADIAVYGKVIGGEMPIGVVAGKSCYMDGIDGGLWNYGDASYPQAEKTFFAGTFNKNHLTMAAAKAILEHLKNQGSALQEQLNQRTSKFAKTLNDYFEQENLPIRIVYFGSLFRFSFKKNLDLFFYHLIEKGVYVWEGRTCFLSTAHTNADIEYVIQAVKESVAQMQAGGFLPERSPNLNESKNKISAQSAAILPPTTTMSSGEIVEPVNVPKTTVSYSDEAVKSDATLTVPLTEAQKQLWVLAQISEEASSAYNVSISLQLRGSLNFTALHQALQKVVERHEALRTTIGSQGDFQQILPFLKVNIPYINLYNVDSYERESKVAEWFKEESLKAFDLSEGPLFRCYVLKLEEQLHLLVMTVHHIVVDGWSMNVILQELGALYSQDCQGEVCQLKPPMQFREYINWQDHLSQTEEMAAHESYWLEKFASSTPVLNLPTNRPRPPIKTYRGNRQTLRLNASLFAQVKQLSTRKGCTPFMTLLSAYTAFLHRLTNQEDIVVGIPSSGRSSVGSEKLVGYCAHLLPIRSCVVDNLTFSEHLDKVKNELLYAYEHQDYPFAWLLKQLKSDRDASHSPIIATIFNLERPVAVPKMFGLETEIFAPPISFTGFDISFNVIEIGSELTFNCEYNTDLFDAATISRILGYFQTFLEGIITLPEQRLFELPLLSEAEQHQLLVEWNNTQVDYPQDKCIHQLFEEQVDKTPDAIAVVFENQQLTYEQLNQTANQLAHHLQTLGVGPEVLVGICVERSIEMVVGLLGILKAGGAYVPLDPSYPQERLNYMLTDSGVQVLVTQQSLLESLPSHTAQVICLDSDWRAIEQHPQYNLDVGVGADNLAYVIYTSGSTGQPKGAMNTHQGIRNRLLWMQDAYQLTRADQPHGSAERVLQKTPFSFDVSVWEFFWPLLTGASIVIAKPEGHKDSNYLVNLISSQQITTVHFVPSMLKVFLQEPNCGNCSCLKRVICSGEELPFELTERFFSTIECELHNLYGPTEAAIDVTFWQCQLQENRQLVPIGRPIANTKVYILDKQLQPVPIGVPGELYIGGDGLARGYLNRPELTSEKFIPNPFSDDKSERLYKTGDLARYGSDGNITFMGRIDNQIKIRGFRIELGEIEAVLTKHPKVQEAVVIAREDQPGDKRLVAYVVSNQHQVPTTSELQGFLKEKLPNYMVPSVFVMQSVLPLTSNGKVDRKALPAPDLSTSDLEEGFVAPSTPTEEILAKLWMEVIGRKQVGIYDNFFEIGGNSLLIIEVESKVREIFNTNISVNDLFKYPTISNLAKYLSQEKNVEQTAFAPSDELVKKQKEAIKRQKQLMKQKRKANV
ncbi:MAG: amino acid adenylation domain-containing protein [Cyanobacteria bacterium J06635_10]